MMPDTEATTTAPPVKPSTFTVCAIGTGQLFAWGSSYYLLSIMAAPITRDTGWPHDWLLGALSLGMLVSGLISPRVGRIIEHRGGRPVLAASALLFALGLIVLAVAPTLAVFVVAWLIIGAAMGAGLYDPTFAALGRAYGDQARGAITIVTLFGGLASTVCWPLNAFLIDHLGWRGACAAFAAIHLAVVLPLYLIGMPKEARRAPVRAPAMSTASGGTDPTSRFAFTVLAAGFTLAAVVMTIVAVQVIPLLQARGMSLTAAVGYGALIGPSQVGARALEAAFGRRHHPIWSLLLSAVLLAVGLAFLLGPSTIIGVGLVLYGSGSGIRYIARGTVPLALFGPDGYATLMGRIAMPVLIAQAASPFIGGLLLEQLGPSITTMALIVAAAINVALVFPLMRFTSRRSTGTRPPVIAN